MRGWICCQCKQMNAYADRQDDPVKVCAIPECGHKVCGNPTMLRMSEERVKEISERG